MADLADMRHELMGRVQAVMTACCDYRSAFDHYSYLYGEDTKEFFRQFLLYGHILTAAEIEAHAENGVPESPPTLQQFREQIDSYEKIYEEVNRIEPISIFQSWMKVDARPFKASLLNVIKCVTDAMFEPLKQTVELLKTYEQELPEEVYKQLEKLPEKWNNIKKLAIAVKQHVAPLQANEMTVLRKSCSAFDVEQHRFREFDTKKPYQLLDTKHIEIKQMESAMTSIYESAGLFEVMVPDYKQLKQCRKELCLLKELWDMISLVGLDDWQTTKWVDINVENMDLECKKFAREIRNLDKEVRAWDAFSGLDSKVKNMLTALKAVAELQNPAIRERHWNQLMQVTGVRFVMDSDTTLADLLKLNLHNFEDEVRGIVDKAVPEMSMEKVLKELKMTWSTMEFQYEPHPRTNIPLLKSDEELIEILEDNQVQLQNLITSKYIAFFLEEVSIWQRKLSTMDSIISLWFEVQHTWSHLESIFIGSEDIRAQLPEDSKRFEGIDVDFKELAYEAQKTPNVVEATNKPGLSQQLEDIQSRLSLCEKALAEYLDMKRLAFPRFYFVSSADLLDILSNGTNPQLVQRHLSKLFDNLARMKFQLDSEQKPTKAGLGMYSREEEYVSFSEPCDCSGQSCGNIYKGLSQTGAWGCFDEFNRISVEVLSVVAVQVKSVQDAIREKKKSFNFLGEDINLVPSVGIFITMNPGYAGRTELPENLKALFRPCAMVVPDFELICEIMLVAEGFIEARALARKFITLYQLCKELLSKQDHYDWGLRAIKSVLVVAGSLKRDDPERPEDQVLMRSLRDFNIPKIVTDDVPVFMGLIGDLFPALDVPRKRDLNFESFVRQAVLDLRLQAEDNFVLKVVKLEELLTVRHSVFVVGDAGTGKSQVMRSLNKTYQIMKRRPVWTDLNPKAVTNDELFGIINPATREWKDGLFSSIMRELANITHDGPKWMVLDGDIDPMWIESLNTVMDDNKVLTLASNERIPLNPTMRLVFEISHLRTATPATVSRAGILYINPSDLGWNPPVSSWIDRREIQSERANLTILFDKYLPICLDTLRTRVRCFRKCRTTQLELSCVLTWCHHTLWPLNDLCETSFLGPCGASISQLVDYRVEFSKWWVAEFKTIKFPSQGAVFDFYIDPETKKFEPWSKLIPQFEFDPEMPLQACLVPTTETVRVRYFMDRLLERRRPVMLVGNAGTGKSVLVGDKLSSLDTDAYVVKKVPFNYYTTSAMLQGMLEKPLEKKAGRNYGPPGTKKLVYFIDDLNMPEVDAYGTVQLHTLIRQHLDYGHWYDRTKLSLKEITNVQYVSCMNPTAGSFTISPRLQRHFCVFALSIPGQDALSRIYSTILTQHLTSGNFSGAVQKSAQQLIALALGLHLKVAATFLPTAIKFHYIFNLRDFSNIFQGLLFSTPECLQHPQDLVKLYLHESNRVYRDKMVEEKDYGTFDKIQLETVEKLYEDIEEALEQTKRMNVYCHFAKGVGKPSYRPVPTWEELNKILVEALDSYNEVNAAMSLVLFEDAMCHVFYMLQFSCRINRILESPRGNALLAGVGGSGKQSLTRLAAFISSLELFQITLRKGYGIPDLKADLANLYLKAGVKNIGTVFLMTDAQVADEQFLVLVNDFLASESLENHCYRLRDAFFLIYESGVGRHHLVQVVLCFSPVGSKLRVRSRRFPAIVSCTAVDWFQEWPQEALESVSLRFLQEIETVEDSVKDSISKFMAYVHTSVNEISRLYLSNERRYNYTTPKSFLEQIKLYQNLLLKKGKDLKARMERLENGLEKLKSTSAQVDELKARLAAQELELKQKNEDADKLIWVVGVETEKVSREKAIADEEEQKVALITQEVEQKQKDCEEDLAKAEPALEAAQAALNTLNKNNLTELRSFGSPPSAVSNVTAAVMVLMAPGGKIPKDRSWKAAKAAMARVDGFLDSLIKFDKENIHENCLKALQPYLQDPKFKPEFVTTKSSAAAGLCSWVVNMVQFHAVFCERLNENLRKLTAKFEKATSNKLKCQQEAEATVCTIALANRLVGGLASENVRWAEAVKNFKQQQSTLCGDILLITAFISYLGYFTEKYRQDLLDEIWKQTYLHQLKVPIPVTPSLDPLTMLTDDADVAAWQNEGLPADRMSTENATILTNCERWPLMVDPQLQGIKWMKTKYGEDLQVIRIGQKGYLDTMERALAAGELVLIENLEESMDPVLGPLLGRETIKKGRYIKIGDKECDFNPAFRLILHTKLANPHFQPELQAQCTLINFTVTRDGLEDQLLAAVVNMERPDLEELKVQESKVTETKINEAREHYRPAAARASLLYFIMSGLHAIHPMYQFSLKAFSVVFHKAIERAPPDESLPQRLLNLIDSITFSVFQYTTRGLFECDKLTYTAQVTFQILLMSKEINTVELDFLLRYPAQTRVTSPVEFLSNHSWGGIKALSSMEEFRNLDRDIEGSAKRWKKFVESECPEKEKFPQEWKNKSALQRLCILRAVRPDRMSYAVRDFVEEKLGSKYVVGRSLDFATTFEESGPATPMFFILSPGVDPLKDVEKQGQEVVAEQALDLAAKEGHWVILQNIHLVANWLSSLEKKLEQHSEGSHQDFRVFISAEPAPSPESHIIPQGILENSIKITSEAPTGMHANLHKALDNFNQDTLEMCTRENEFKSILFALCYFHAAVAERRKFGPQGWNRSYPFNTGDLTISVNVLYNYLEASTKVPYDDLRYLFGEIMYGGHITDDWDRRLCKTYLEEFIKPEMLEGELLLAPGFPLPANMDYNGYHQYIDDALPPESPYLDGLHPNAEIGFLTQTSEKLFRTVLEMQPRDTSVGEGGVGTRDETVKALLEEMLEKLMDEFNIAELMAKVEERTPYAVVAFQECERMNILTSEIKRSLKELDLGLKDKDDRDWDFLRTSKPSSGPQKMPVKRGTERSSETTAEQSSRKALIPLDEVRAEWEKSSGPFHKQRVAEHCAVFRDLFRGATFTPWVTLRVEYSQEDEHVVPVYYGNMVTPSEASSPPAVSYEADKGSLWTLLLTNPGNDMQSGKEICHYLPPFPAMGTGYHRFIFLLFKQDRRIDSSEDVRPTLCHRLKLRTLSSFDLYRKHEDGMTPAGLAFQQCQWDSCVSWVSHQLLNMREPVFEFARPPVYHPPQVKFPRHQPLRYLDRYRDSKEPTYGIY
ncbi:hypothetical protein Q9233_010487 [Columba guinea]|nr:hypothetical protein Q9233_010487 [Columba guinea]